MEILGIGPGEFIFILIILLVVVGPERLPDLARQAGRLLVRGRNWLQSSPDAAMVMRARQEIEQELASLKTSLLEVQNVRDEVLGAAKQIGAEVNSLTATTKAELSDLGTIGQPKPAAAPANTISAAPSAPAASAATTAADTSAPPALVNPLQELEATLAQAHGQASAAEAAPEAAAVTDGVAAVPDVLLPHPVPTAEPPGAEASPDAQAAFESIELRLQAIMSDLFALQDQLRQRGVLGADWQPPSWGMQLPAEPSTPEEAVETEEAPNVQ